MNLPGARPLFDPQSVDRLFLATFDQIAELMGAGEFKVPAVAGHLRKLLIDSPSLVDLANQATRLSICYVVNDFESAPLHMWQDGVELWAALDALEPSHLIGVRQRRLSQAELLGYAVMGAGDVEVTVRDLIEYVAYVRGGVHVPKQPHLKDPAGQVVLRLGKCAALVGYSPEIVTIQAVARVVIRGLAPLRRRLRCGLTPSIYDIQQANSSTLPIARPVSSPRRRRERCS